MILVLWLARSLDRLCALSNRGADRVYRVYFAAEARKARRDADRKAIDDKRRVDAIIEDVIAETRPVKRTFDESPFNGETR